MSHDFWMEHFEGGPDVVGARLRIGGVATTVVGVMPRGVDVPSTVALWMPRVERLRLRSGS